MLLNPRRKVANWPSIYETGYSITLSANLPYETGHYQFELILKRQILWKQSHINYVEKNINLVARYKSKDSVANCTSPSSLSRITFALTFIFLSFALNILNFNT